MALPPKTPNIFLLLFVIKHLGALEGRKRIQKIVYLLKEQFGLPITYSFVPHLYGPYSSELQNEIDLLTRSGHLISTRINHLYVYDLTPFGKKVVESIEENMDSKQLKELIGKIENMKDFDTEELVKWSKDVMKKKLGDDIFPY